MPAAAGSIYVDTGAASRWEAPAIETKGFQSLHHFTLVSINKIILCQCVLFYVMVARDLLF
jgi:hypothetical protein